MNPPRKNIAYAVILAVILPGLGLIYAGQVLIGVLAFLAVGLCLVLGTVLSASANSDAIFYGFLALAAVLWAVQAIYTIIAVREYNRTDGRVNQRDQPQSPGLAVFLSAVIPGLGQLYNNQPAKALFFFLTWITLITWPFAVTDAWETATRMNSNANLSVARRAATGVLPGRSR